MGDYLLHHPLVQFYLLIVGVLLFAFIWDRVVPPPPLEDDPPTPGKNRPGRCRSQGARRMREEEPIPGARRLRLSVDPNAAGGQVADRAERGERFDPLPRPSTTSRVARRGRRAP